MDSQLPNILRSARRILSIAIIALLFCSRLLWGLDPDKPVDQYLVDQWEISNGLPSNSIGSIAQTPDGYLWIATPKGLLRCDGMKFSIIHFTGAGNNDSQENTIPDSLFVDKEGVLWIGSSAGLTSYRYQTDQFQTLTPADGLTRDRIRRIKDDIKGNLWISFFTSYLDRYSSGKFTAFNASHGLTGKKINAIIEDAKGNLLFGTREDGVFIYREGKFSPYPIAGLDKCHIIFMHEDRNGQLWIGTNNGLLRVTEKGTDRYTARDGLSNDYVTYIIEDSDNNLWVGTIKGLNRIKKDRENVFHFESVLNPFTIAFLFEDKEKTLWVGTFDSGLRRIKDGKFISFAPAKVPREEILFSLFEDRGGDTWIGSLGGKLYRFKGREYIESVELPRISGMGITCITDDAGGKLWLGTNGNGVFTFQPKNKTLVQLTTREGLADNLVTSIFKDSRGNPWFCTFDGVSRYTNGAMTTLNSRSGLLGKMVHNVYEDKQKNIWIAGDKGITFLKDGQISKENVVHYLQDVSVTCIYEDPAVSASGAGTGTGVFWLATHGVGLKRFKNGTFTSFTTAEGMTTNFIYQFFEDPQENFWLMSDSGILRVSKKELNRFADGGGASGGPEGENIINCTSFGIPDGMKSIEFNNQLSRNSALKTANGELWFITKKGITIVNPRKIQINKVPPPVVIEAVLFNEQAIPLRGPLANEDAHTFKGITDFQFQFTAPTFLSQEKIKFKYRLEGVDNEWVFLPPGKERVAHYRDLAPGVYTFRVLASNSDGLWNQTGDAVTFTLKALFYKTPLFRIVVILLLMAAVAAGFYGYKKHLLKKKARYKTSSINPQYAEECVKKLKRLMETEKLYREPDLSLQGLAEKMGVGHHVVSQVLNEKLNRNFSDYINSYRIEEAKKILEGPLKEDVKITAVAFDVGFNTMVAFYNAFKKYTGMTPSEYKKGRNCQP
ncbi:MAG: Helix-turn-helix protein [Acidobacteriota bacterium]|nr:Helix-turn-helix protein [Acidobacteriota bacterium]